MIERVVLRGQRPRLGFLLAMLVFAAFMVATAAGHIAMTVLASDAENGLPWPFTLMFVLLASWLVCEVAKMAGLLRVATVIFDPDGYRVTTPFLPGTRHRSAPRRGEQTSLSVDVFTGEGEGLVRYRFTLAQASSVARFGAFVPLTTSSVEALVQAFAQYSTPLVVQPSILASAVVQGRAGRRSALAAPDEVITLWVEPGRPDSMELATPALTLRYAPIAIPPSDIGDQPARGLWDEPVQLREIGIREAPRVMLAAGFEPPVQLNHISHDDFRESLAHIQIIGDRDDASPLVFLVASAPVAGLDVYVRDGAIPDVYFHLHAAS